MQITGNHRTHTTRRTSAQNSSQSNLSVDRYTPSWEPQLNLMRPGMVPRPNGGSEDPSLLARRAVNGDKHSADLLAYRHLYTPFLERSEAGQAQFLHIIRTLKKGDQKLPKALVKALARYAGEYSLGDYQAQPREKMEASVRQTLSSLASNGNPHARAVLRDKAQKSHHIEFHGHLAQASEHLEAQDFALLVGKYDPGASKYNNSAQSIRQAVEGALAKGSRPAVDGILVSLSDENTNELQTRRLFELLSKHPENLKADDLKRLATHKDKNKMTTLVAAATAEKPVKESLQVLRAALGEDKQLPHTAWQNLVDWAKDTKDEGRLAQMADLILSGPLTDKDVKARAIAALGARAAEGDKEAIAYLRKYDRAFGQNRDRIDHSLDQAARGGNAQGMTHVTEGLAKSGSHQDLSTSLETLRLQKDKLGLEQVKALDHVMNTQFTHEPDPDYRKAAELLATAANGKDPEVSKAAIASLLQRVGKKDGKGDDHASRALALAVSRLDQKALEVLANHPNKDAVNTLLSAKDLKPEQRQRLFSRMQKHLEGVDRSEVLRVGIAWAGDLGSAEIAAIGKVGNYQSGAVEALLAVAARQKKPELREQALNTVFQGGMSPWNKHWDRFAELASEAGSPKLKAAAEGKLPRSPLSDSRLSQVNQQFQDLLAQRIKDAPEGSRLHKLGQFMRAQAMAADPKNEYSSQIDQTKLKEKYEKFLSDPKVVAELEGVREDAIKRVFGPGGREKAVAESAEYLLSKTFQQRLELMPAEQRSAALQTELTRLHALSPEKAKEVQAALGDKVNDSSLDLLRKLNPQERERGVEEALKASKNEGLAVGVKSAKNGGKLAKYLSKAIDLTADAKYASMKAPERLKAALEELSRGRDFDPALKGQALRLIGDLNKKGKLGTFLAASSVASLALRGVPQNGKEVFKSSADLLSVIGESESLLKAGRGLKLLSFGDEALKASKFLKLAKIAGPIGNILSAGVDGYGAFKAYEKGDYWEMAGKGGAAVGSGAMVAGGIMLATPLAPVGAVMVIGGVILSVGGTLVDWFMGRDDTQDMLYDLGVYKG